MITFIPVHNLPKTFAVGRSVREEDIATHAVLSQSDGFGGEAKSKGQILWIRSISRLQQQVRLHVMVMSRIHVLGFHVLELTF